MNSNTDSYWLMIWKQFYKHRLGRYAFYVVVLFCLAGVYAPFLASSKPLVVQYNGEWFFPLFRYLFYRGYYTKGLDLFFNLLIFTLPLGLLSFWLFRKRPKVLTSSLVTLILIQIGLFFIFFLGPSQDPASDINLSRKRQQALASKSLPDWNFDLKFMTDYAKLNLVLNYQQRLAQQKHLENYIPKEQMQSAATLWQQNWLNEERELQRQRNILSSSIATDAARKRAEANIKYLMQKRSWLNEQLNLLKYEINPLIRPFHWEDDAGGDQNLNSLVSFWDLTRINRKDLVAALIFGVRVSLVVGILSVLIALSVGLPIGAVAGYYGGSFDIVVSRLLEIWEAMPTFFMLLMVVAITQSKSIFLVISVIGLFGWTSFSRYIRGEFFKQRNLPYIEACRATGFGDRRIIFSHILPNALPPVLTLLPFAIMGAITSEAGLSFLGLGEENSASWGVLMDEGRTAFPSQSYLLWPPAILLTILLVAIALVGDSLRDALDPKMHR